jgi:hypothetical protein
VLSSVSYLIVNVTFTHSDFVREFLLRHSFRVEKLLDATSSDFKRRKHLL